MVKSAVTVPTTSYRKSVRKAAQSIGCFIIDEGTDQRGIKTNDRVRLHSPAIVQVSILHHLLYRNRGYCLQSDTMTDHELCSYPPETDESKQRRRTYVLNVPRDTNTPADVIWQSIAVHVRIISERDGGIHVMSLIVHRQRQSERVGENGTWLIGG